MNPGQLFQLWIVWTGVNAGFQSPKILQNFALSFLRYAGCKNARPERNVDAFIVSVDPLGISNMNCALLLSGDPSAIAQVTDTSNHNGRGVISSALRLRNDAALRE